MHAVTRRGTLHAGLAGAALALGAGALLDRVDAQTAPALRVRQSVGALGPDHPVLEAYRQAVAVMRSLPGTDRRSWSYQAEIHYNHCPHTNWYFQPWHRAYLLAFEEMCRAALPNTSPLKTTFALPYWDWTQDRQLPVAFTGATWKGQANPLLNTTRTVSPGTSLPDEFVGPAVIDSALAPTSFQLFGSSRPPGQTDLDPTWQRAPGTTGPLESRPHNIVHNWIGGEMNDYHSPLDPIFWLHHANCDRLWEEWNARGNANATSWLWRRFTFRRNFARPDGTLFNVTVRDLTDPVALGYRYDSSGAQPAAAAPPRAGARPLGRFAAGNALSAGRLRPLTVSVPIDRATLAGASRVTATLRAVALGAGENPLVRVFVEHPSLSPTTPPAAPYHVATLAFFGAHARHRPTSFALDLTRTIDGLRRAGHVFGGRLAVQMVLATPTGGVPLAPADVRPAGVEVELYA